MVQIEKWGFYGTNKVLRFKNSNFQYFRANNSGFTVQILLIIKVIQDLVFINTLCNFGTGWLENQVFIVLTRFKTAIFNNSRANNFSVTREISLIIELIWDLMPINTLCNFGTDWLRNVVSIVLTRFKTAIFNFQGQLLWSYWADFAHYGTHVRSCAHKHFRQLWSRLIQECGLYCANMKKAIRRTDALPWHKPRWPLDSGAKNALSHILGLLSTNIQLDKVTLKVDLSRNESVYIWMDAILLIYWYATCFFAFFFCGGGGVKISLKILLASNIS